MLIAGWDFALTLTGGAWLDVFKGPWIYSGAWRIYGLGVPVGWLGMKG